MKSRAQDTRSILPGKSPTLAANRSFCAADTQCEANLLLEIDRLEKRDKRVLNSRQAKRVPAG